MESLVVPGMLRAAADAVPEMTALILDGDRELSYGRWRVRADQFAVALQSRGVNHADRVGLIYSGADWLDYAVAYFGVLTCGATAVLLPAQLPSGELARLASSYRLALVVVGQGQAAPVLDRPVVRHADLEGAGAPGGTPRPVDITPDDVAEIIFTSGTTGLVKGVEASHRSMLYRGKQPDPRVLMHALPLGTTAAQMLMVDAVRGHQTLVLMSEFHPGRFCRLVTAHTPCWIAMAPAVGAMLVRTGAHRRFRLPSVTGVTFVSAPLQPATLGQLRSLFPSATIRNYYSSTEAAPAGVGTVFDPARPMSVGKPDTGSAVRVVDERGQQVAAGVSGEVLLRAEDAGGRRYADDQAASAATFQDGWVRTGDLGYLDADGYLYLVDRKTDTINAGGMKVSTVEVEHALGRHPAVLEVAVYGRPHPALGEVVEAAVITDPRVPAVDPADLTRFCAERLARYQVPARIRLVDDFPRNALGKPLKRVLAGRAAGPEGSAEGPLVRSGDEAPAENAASAQTIRLTAKAVVVRDDRILLVEYRCPGDTGHFSLPGGRPRAGESLSETLVRKVREETCLDVRAERLFQVVEYVPDRHGHVYGPVHRVQLLFRCVPLDPDQEPRMPQSHAPGQYAVRWVPVAELARIRLQPAVAEPLREALARPAEPDLLAS